MPMFGLPGPGLNLPSIIPEAEATADSLSAPMRDIYKRKKDAMKPVQEKIRKETEAMVNLPQPEQKPLPEYQAPKLNKKVFTGFLIAATIFGTLASIKSKKPLTTALTAFSGFVEGFTKGNQLQMEKAYNEYKINMDRALIENENAQRLYQAAYKKHGDNIELLKLELGEIAGQFDDEIMMDAARRGDFKFMIGYIQDMQKMNLDMQRHGERIGAEYEKIELSRQRLNKTGAQKANNLPSKVREWNAAHGRDQNAAIPPKEREEFMKYLQREEEPPFDFVTDPETGLIKLVPGGTGKTEPPVSKGGETTEGTPDFSKLDTLLKKK